MTRKNKYTRHDELWYVFSGFSLNLCCTGSFCFLLDLWSHHFIIHLGTVSKTYSIIQLCSSKESLSKDLSGPDFVMIHEGTPLFFRRRRRSIPEHESLTNWKVLSLLLILTMGLSIGIYLLVIESIKHWPIPAKSKINSI
jgi:hypothetical protein